MVFLLLVLSDNILDLLGQKKGTIQVHSICVFLLF